MFAKKKLIVNQICIKIPSHLYSQWFQN